ncbi:MAG: hypothetical protein V3W20_14285 [Candidatus Neomarinimicrobiota bacterium]
MINKYMGLIFIPCMMALNQGCVMSEVESMVKTSANSVATVQVANSVKTFANTRRIKAETTKDFVKDVATLIDKQPIEKQSELIKESIEAQVSISKNTFLKGFIYSTAFWSFIIFLGFILKYVFDRYKPKILKATYE